MVAHPATPARRRQVFDQIVTPGPDTARHERANRFFKANQEKGAREFGESADNMTGVLVYLERGGQETARDDGERRSGVSVASSGLDGAGGGGDESLRRSGVSAGSDRDRNSSNSAQWI